MASLAAPVEMGWPGEGYPGDHRQQPEYLESGIARPISTG
jgi:hypothetical protein